MEFPGLLRTSRLSSLAHPIKQSMNEMSSANPYPRYQVLATTPSSLYRRNWGVKAPIPSKHQSPYVVLDALDSPHGIAQYQAGASFVRKQQRFRELGVPLNLSPGADDYFHIRSAENRRPTLRSLSSSKVQKLLKQAPSKRQEFVKHLETRSKAEASSGPSTGTSGYLDSSLFAEAAVSQNSSSARHFNRSEMDLGRVASSFMGLSPERWESYGKKTRGPIGLNYGVKGTLHNTPKGIMNGKIVQGRVAVSKTTGSYAGRGPIRACGIVGGFVVDTPIVSTVDSATKVKKVQQFYVRSAHVVGPSMLKIHANTVGNQLL
uniref:ARAD1B19140p n=1 Tax=Blastobotrys adeninivorans TaxID=409370 RepID=A0A060TCX3_BLAAD